MPSPAFYACDLSSSTLETVCDCDAAAAADAESALEAAKALLESSKDKTWQQLVSAQLDDIQGRPYCERLSEEELEKSQMSYRDSLRIYRSRSVDLGFLSRESYLSQWNRERTPVHNQERYRSHVRRSYTPVREIAAVE
ncbi:hypothetical protein TELCIR_04489, partial [Teladorsagia circumcincta]